MLRRLPFIVLLAGLFVLLWPRSLDVPPPRPLPPWNGPTLRVAAVQFDARPEEKAHNLAQMERLARAAVARGARVVLFHESSLVDYTLRVPELAEPVPQGPSCRRMIALARELDAVLAFGLSERAGARQHITHVFVGPDGPLHAYRKTWLFRNEDGGLRDEWARYDPGTGPAPFEIDGVRATALICSDAFSHRCVERVRALEPQIVFFPNNRSSLPLPPSFAELARRVRAPLVVANRCGRSWRFECIGGSTILDANGRALAQANRDGREEIVLADVPIRGARHSK